MNIKQQTFYEWFCELGESISALKKAIREQFLADWHKFLNIPEYIFHYKELRRLRARDRQLDSLLKLLQNNGYMVLDSLEKAIILSALDYWAFKEFMKEPKRKAIHRTIYKDLKEKLRKELGHGTPN